MIRIASVLLVALLSGPLWSGLAHAQSWPTKPVKIIVPSPAGSAPDIIARLVGDKLVTIWGKQIVIENRPGAGGNVAMAAFNRSEKDGHTFASVMATVVTLTPHLFKDMQYSIDTDVAPVATLGISPMMIAVNPALGVSSLEELANFAKARPGKVNFALPLLNSVPHLAGEMLSNAAGIKLYPVAYNGSVASVTATMTGEGHVTIDGLPPLVAQVKAGKLKALAVTSKKRLPGYENIPTANETYPGLEALGWFSLLAQAGTAPAIIERVNRDINQVLQMPDIVARFNDLGVYPEPGSVQAAADFIKSERALWARVVRDAGIKPQ